MATLTDRQRDELHRSIASYLSSRGLDRTLAAFREETGLEVDDERNGKHDDGSQNGMTSLAADARRFDGLLERKWTSVVRLQKKTMELERQLADLKAALPAHQSLHAPTNGADDGQDKTADGKKEKSWSPAAPAQTILAGHRLSVVALAFHPVHTTLATGSDDTSIKLWDWQSGKLEKTLPGHGKAITSLDFSTPGSSSSGALLNDTLLASASTDTTIRLYDPSKDYQQVRTLYGHEHVVSSVRFFANPARWRSRAASAPTELAAASRELLVSCSRDGSVRIWDPRSGVCLGAFVCTDGYDPWVRVCEPSPDGTLLLAGGHDNAARVFDVVKAVTLSRASAAKGSTSNLVEPIIVGMNHEHVIEAVAWAPPAAYARLSQLQPSGHEHELSPNSRFCATGSRDRRIGLWEVTRSAALLAWLVGHDGWVRSLEFSPVGDWLFSAGDDKTIRCWDLSALQTSSSSVASEAGGTREVTCTRVVQQAHDHFVAQIRWAHTPASLRDLRQAQRDIGRKQRRLQQATNGTATNRNDDDNDDEQEDGDRRRLTVLASCGVDKVAKVWMPT